MKRGDRFVLTIICGVALVSLSPFLFRQETGRYATVTRDGLVVERIDLQGADLPRRIEVTGDGGASNMILVEPGRVRILESNCVNGLCVERGWLDKPGDTAVCLPHRVMVTVEGEGEFDAVSR